MGRVAVENLLWVDVKSLKDPCEGNGEFGTDQT